MSDLEQRLRTAMTAATEPAPSGLMDGIRRRHQRHRRRVTAGSVAAVAAIGLAVLPMVLPRSPHPARSGAVASSSPAIRLLPVVVPRNPLGKLACNDARWTQLGAGWQASGLRVGSVWLRAGGDQNARVHALTVEVAYGTLASLQVSLPSFSYFKFFTSLVPGGSKPLPPGDTGMILTSCPRGTGNGPNGQFTDFSVGFSLPAGRSATVDVWTPGARNLTRVTFTCTRHGCVVHE